MRIGIFFPSAEHTDIDDMIQRVSVVADEGFDTAWLPQSFSFDALTALTAIGREVDGLELGTSVVPTYPRHPFALAAQALTTNAAIDGRLALGIGLSHARAVEGRFGMSYDRPARHMREYLSVLLPLVRERRVDFAGETLSGHGDLVIPSAQACPVYLAALQPAMLTMAGSLADGTITWCTGPITLRQQIVPIITTAAAEAGRPEPRIVVALPCCVTDDEADGRVKAGAQLEGYGQIPAYRAVLDREGADGPADVSVVGDEASVTAQLEALFEIGATDFEAILCGTDGDRDRTRAHLAALRQT
ncbi:MAG TPA: TIGR03564 family F420-dependent LLM class oxidoreductase [Acidimicrobiales bacterium]|nr:TIGR03564 family F420-dependent LLM class oxidoreductase [Acidimicrobiales bacterium]